MKTNQGILYSAALNYIGDDGAQTAVVLDFTYAPCYNINAGYDSEFTY